MKLTLNLLAAAAALVFVGQASAALTTGQAQGGSSMVLSVWDSVNNVTYVRNLGNNLNGFLPSGLTTLANDGNVAGTPVTGDKTPNAGLLLTFPGDPLFGTTFQGSLASNIQWNVMAYDAVASNGGGLSRVITTANSKPGSTNAAIGLIGTGAAQYFDDLLSRTGIATANSVAGSDPSVASFAGAANFGDTLNGGNLNSAATGYGSQIGFYYLARTQISGVNGTLATNRQFGNDVNFATWTLGSDGTATYNVSAVPLPPALWMFGSGLVGLLGYARRRKSAASATSPA